MLKMEGTKTRLSAEEGTGMSLWVWKLEIESGHGTSSSIWKILEKIWDGVE